MTDYRIFNETDALNYARQEVEFFAADADLVSNEFGDGNLNLVFKVVDQKSGRSLILKQALPYARCVGESWPLSTDRARIEAEVLMLHEKICPQHTVHIVKFDRDLSLIVMEDLSDHLIWRSALIQRKELPLAGQHIGTYLAKTLFFTSDYYLDPQQKKAKVAQFINPELCLITEDLFFTDPYRQHERNNYNPLLESEVQKIQSDPHLQAKVALLKYKFLNQAQALLHGDVHSGSVFVNESSTKVIDAEFGFYGPIAFDVGSVIGNLLLNYAGQPGLSETHVAQVYRQYLLDQIRQIWFTFAAEFARLMAAETTDVAFQVAEYQQLALQQIFVDAIGYAGTELIRRTIGLAHVADLDNIESTEQRAECELGALKLGQALIKNASELDDIEAVIQCIEKLAAS
ncbi:S-methyl-5-thioribose kinase [Catenovulum sediminis]|uniref:Methylthioribose kinase n=1 Tax=Catenovulum sediminis TaxID=1740262 RepID=A0ABV1RCJ9_9ALTE|nr:S-methyl-5-thioribose kinase [Catenovulum sediminis]